MRSCQGTYLAAHHHRRRYLDARVGTEPEPSLDAATSAGGHGSKGTVAKPLERSPSRGTLSPARGPATAPPPSPTAMAVSLDLACAGLGKWGEERKQGRGVRPWPRNGRCCSSPSPVGTPARALLRRRLRCDRIGDETEEMDLGFLGATGSAFCSCEMAGQPSDLRSAKMDGSPRPGTNRPGNDPGGGEARASLAACPLVAGPRAQVEV
jgi:hypothetical protein